MDKQTPRETLTPDDLNRVYFRAQDDQGHWQNVSADEASDKQFDIWAKSHIPIEGDDAPWSSNERAHFCNMLWQAGALHILKKGIKKDG